MPLPTLKGAGVRLRWLELADAAALYAIFSDTDVTRYWSSPPQKELEDAVELIRSIHAFHEDGSLYQWGIEDAAGDVIGTCTLAGIDRSNARAEIGFAVASSRWGRGLASEAVGLLLDHAFGAMSLERIEADVDPDNARSLRLLERLGFQREGYLRERWRVGGGVQDSVILGLLRREWISDHAKRR